MITDEIVHKGNSQASSGNALGPFLLSLGTGLGGYALGKHHGRNEGYDQAKVEDNNLIAECQVQIQNMRRNSVHLQAENTKLLQDIGSLRKENQILKDVLKKQPSTPQDEAILEKLEQVEFRLIQALPPIFEDGDHNTEQN